MDYSIMSEREILSYADPVTDLEKALFELLQNGLECAAEAEQDADRARADASDLEDELGMRNQEIDECKDKARDIIDFLDEKEFEGKDGLIKMLSEIIDV